MDNNMITWCTANKKVAEELFDRIKSFNCITNDEAIGITEETLRFIYEYSDDKRRWSFIRRSFEELIKDLPKEPISTITKSGTHNKNF